MSLRLLSVVILLAGVTLTGSSALHAQARASNKTTAEIYKAFLSSWRGKDKAPMNVAEGTETLSKQDLEEFSSCAGGHHEWAPAATNASLATQLSALPWVHFVDPAKWQAADPGDLIAKGKSVDEAVEQGFSHALLTLSTVAFDSSGEFAALKYSLVCGQLCGNGGTVLFEHTGQGWVRSRKRCSMWLSFSGRPNMSFKADGYAAA
ncbi:MAG: hypothetical protein B7X39_16735 [Lysobacterales bacterium 14-68-21]|jgi:hypothetical protein|nr:MAG: hypothetical protein B7X45_14725 [Xanthomonadales bacterium 15-68-25]OZB64446.1 MAG: hypothetical protein B7X39_16735 [Xanthomonadales bacterium 14-68-21]